MLLDVDEVLVGERGRAHDVLASSLPIDLARAIAHHLDLPGQLPPGFELQNYVSGFPHADRYVIARTSLDPTADRQGMVFSHALIFDADAVASLNHIAPLFRRLKTNRPNIVTANRTTVETADPCPAKSPAPQLCDLLVSPPSGPVVIADPLALEPAIASLWPRLLPSLRRHFRFRLSFGPEELNAARLHVAAVPGQTVTRWPPDRVLDLESRLETPNTPAGRYLHGDSEPELVSFLDDLAIVCDTFEDLSLASRALQLFRLKPAFDSTLAAVRLIGSLQPDPGKGASIKRTSLERLGTQPGPRTVEQFLALRNLDLAPFHGRRAFLDNLVPHFQALFESSQDPGVLLAVATSAFHASQSTDGWRHAFENALSGLSSKGANATAPLVWQVLSAQPVLGEFLLRKIQNVPSMDRALAESFCQPIGMDPQTLSEALVGFRFVLAESEVLIHRHDGVLLAALHDACDRDRHRYGDTAVNHIIGRLSPTERVSAALNIGDPLVASAASAAVAADPHLLAELPLGDARVQEIWSQALKLDRKAWRVALNTGALRERVFSGLVDGEMSPSLIQTLVDTPLGNLLDYSRRADIWAVIPTPSKSICLRATATAWIRSLPDRAGNPGYLEPERQLATAIASLALLPDLEHAILDLGFDDVLTMFAANPDLPATLFGQALNAFCASVTDSSKEHARRAARLVAARDWSQLTREVWRNHANAPNLRVFFEICADHLDYWDRILHGIDRPTREDLHRLLVDVVCELYPRGPMDAEIWTRAGGSPSKLDILGSGEQQWSAAVQKIRYGDRITASDLIAKMLEDYPRNDKLQYLAGKL